MSETGQYLTFTLGGEVFALDIGTVREVLELTTVTRIPRTPEFMRGVINLRGRAVPVLELRRKFQMPVAADTVNTCIIIVEALLDDEPAIIGALVDSVREVVEIPATSIEAAPRLGTAIRQDFIRGMGRQHEGFVIILDGNRIFSVDELTAAGEAAVLDAAPSSSAMPVEVQTG
ncbi:chemotaxis protein CheW [Nitratidesulfovibrio vulgaris]|uniref:Chemotaxis protein CheW n=1 Tax=Nitratidesulfovibrio vulgaris (strain ATCC 29579 / DSM 644 / CCUG 34227 / NCIMB 8303 / VKM B-1760 / Hildenborough) TaxID=882 RepID=Q72EI6_NITV2|nr:chemotaxis protein CheW [Nitratidesulfovibrio vulgaris]AAS95073.1 chemotaxis protein CheW [Nitratidesulfovibrio vulgaris str. Hildenborough]ADP85712.1 CheW protein [Nitratidesulfovibrio vulgaris RCH1]